MWLIAAVEDSVCLETHVRTYTRAHTHTHIDPLLLWKVNLSVSSFITCSCLFARYSSIFLPLEFVLTSCHIFDLALLSTAIKIPPPLTNLISPTILVKLFSIRSSISKYMLATKNLRFSCIISKNTVSSSDNFAMSMVSILLFIITMAALFWYSYGS